MKTTMNDKLLGIINGLLDLGAIIELYKSGGSLCADLQTGMKSHCYLVAHDDMIVAEMRYDKSVEIDTVDDVLAAVKSCMQGRTYLSSAWDDVFKQIGYYGAG